MVFLIGAAHSNNWKMDKKLGGILLFWYFVVMAVASLYETNILGKENLKEGETGLSTKLNFKLIRAKY